MHYIFGNDNIQCKLKLQGLADCHYDLTDLMIMLLFTPRETLHFHLILDFICLRYHRTI